MEGVSTNVGCITEKASGIERTGTGDTRDFVSCGGWSKQVLEFGRIGNGIADRGGVGHKIDNKQVCGVYGRLGGRDEDYELGSGGNKDIK